MNKATKAKTTTLRGCACAFDEVLEALHRYDGWGGVLAEAALAKYLDRSESSVRLALCLLRSAGKIRKVTRRDGNTRENQYFIIK